MKIVLSCYQVKIMGYKIVFESIMVTSNQKTYNGNTEIKSKKQAGRGGSRLFSQHFGRPRQADHEVRSLSPA